MCNYVSPRFLCVMAYINSSTYRQSIMHSIVFIYLFIYKGKCTSLDIFSLHSKCKYARVSKKANFHCTFLGRSTHHHITHCVVWYHNL